MYMQNEIRGINIKKVLWKIIFGWKLMLVSGIVFAILFAGYKYMSDSETNNSKETITGQVSGAELQKVNELLAYYDRLNFYEDYYENSLMFKMNPEKYQYLVLQYYVDSEYLFNPEQNNEIDYTTALVSAYQGYFSNNKFSEDLKNELDTNIEAKYLKELIQSTASVESYTIQMTVGIPDGFSAELFEASIEKIIDKKSLSFENIGAHKIQKINSSLNISYSTSVEQLIYSTRTTIEGLKKNIESVKSGLSSNQKMYMYNNLKVDRYKSDFYIKNTVGAGIKPSINVTFAVIGFILGIFVVCALYLMREILSGKLQNEDDLEIVYGIKKFGAIEVKDKDSKRFIVDKLLYKIKNINNNMLSNEEQIKYAASAVMLSCQEHNISEICLLQSRKLNTCNEMKDKLIKALKVHNIKCEIVSDIDSDSEGLKKMVSLENVVLFEQLNKSRYTDMENAIKITGQYNVNVLGSIIII